MTLDWVFRLGQILAQYHYWAIRNLFYFLLQAFHTKYHGPQGSKHIRSNDNTIMTIFSYRARFIDPCYVFPVP